MTREQFLSQAESVKPGLTEEQFIQAVVMDVNMCEYLAVQNQMYSIENFLDAFYIDYIERCMICNVISAIEFLEEYPNTSKKEIEDMVHWMDTGFEINRLVPDGDLYAYELVYLFLRNKYVKKVRDILNMTEYTFIQKYLMSHMYPQKGKSVCEYTYIMKQDENPKPSVQPIAEEPISTPVIITTPTEPLTGEIIDEITEVVLNSAEINEFFKDLSDELLATYNMVMEHAADMSKEDLDKLIEMFGKDNIDSIRSGKESVETIWPKFVEKIIDKEAIMRDDGITEKAWNMIMQKFLENGMVNKLIEFNDEREVEPEEVSRILKILFSSNIQEQLKKYKVRNKKACCTYKEMSDFDYDRQKYNFAFVADSMFKDKKIVILLNSNRAEDDVVVMLIDC